MSMSSAPADSVALFGFRPRLAPVFGADSASADAALGGRPGFFLATMSAAIAAGATFSNLMTDAFSGDLDAGTVLTLNSGFLIAVLAATVTTAFGVMVLEAGLAATLVVGFAADWTGFLDF
ncbi:MAG: hypothetical protein Q7S97_12965 [Polaromonas sp.]|nr:hypothetical protein [Polaromonas sp.]